MSDRPLPQENLFLGSVVDQRATSDVVSALYEVPSLPAAIPCTHTPHQTLFRSGTSSVSGYIAPWVKKSACRLPLSWCFYATRAGGADSTAARSRAALRRSVRCRAATLWAEGRAGASLINKRLATVSPLFPRLHFVSSVARRQVAYLADKLL